MNISKQLSSSLTTLENYVLASDKNQFYEALPNGFEKKLIDIMRRPYHQKISDELQKIGVQPMIRSYISDYKIFEAVQNAKKVEDLRFLTAGIKLSLSTQIINEPNQFLSGQVGFQSESQEKRKPSEIKTSKNLCDFMKEKIDYIRRNQPQLGRANHLLSSFSTYAILKLFKEDPDYKNLILDCMPLVEKQYLIQSRQNFFTNILGEQEAVDFLIEFYKVYTKKHDPTFRFSSHIYQYLTTIQINNLGKSLPDLFLQQEYCYVWFRSNYSLRFPILTTNNEVLNIEEKKQKKRILLQMIQTINSLFDPLPSTLRCIQLQCLNKLLFLERDSYDATPETLLMYLSKYPERLSLHNEDYNRLMDSKRDPSSRFSIQNVAGSDFSAITNSNNINQLMIEHLGMLFENENDEQFKDEKIDGGIRIDHNQFLKYIDYDIYFGTKAKTLLKKGKQIEGLYEKVLSKTEIDKIKAERSLKIHPMDNCKYLGIKDHLELKLEVKNIDNLMVKIYEVDLQKYYLEKKQEVGNELNLQSLTPSSKFERQIEVKSEFQVMKYNLPVELKESRGLFIVEIEGKGQSSRAIIRKGAIIPIKKYKLAGVEVSFYYEDSTKVPDGSYFWLDQRKHVIKDGKCTIPYGKASQQFSGIVVAEDFSHLFKIKIPAEEYYLDVIYLYNPENFIIGNKAKVILHPRLYLRADEGTLEQMVSLKLLKNINIHVQIVDNLGIKSSLKFKEIKLSEKDDYVLDIPIQTYTTNILIYGSAFIEKYNGEKQNMEFVESIHIQGATNSQKIGGVYLKKDFNDKTNKQNYLLHVFGLNGEPLENIQTRVSVQLEHTNHNQSYSVTSNDRGQINLGPLDLVKRLDVSADHSSGHQGFESKTWYLKPSNNARKMLYTFKKGETALVPLSQTYTSEFQNCEDFRLYKIKENIKLDDCSHKIKRINKYLEIKELDEGSYKLSMIKQGLVASIQILEGTEFEKPNQIYVESKSKIYEIVKNPSSYIMLGKAQIQEKENHNQIVIPFIKPEGMVMSNSLKAHVLVSNFIPENSNYMSTQQEADRRIHKFERPGNTYLSNKQLPEETAYVLNRRNEKQFIGNNFEKPHMLLKRINLRDTSQVDEKMDAGNNYQKVQYNNTATRADQEEEEFKTSYQGIQIERNSISSHNNFLAFAGQSFANLKEADQLKFKLPKVYGYFQVVLVSNKSFIKQSYYVPHSNLKTKSIAHIGLPKEEDKKAISISRQIYPLWQTGKNSLSISRNSKWSAISLNNIKNFAESSGIQLDEWIDKWQSMSKEEKLKMYNKKMCHELNCFIKHQDIEFFREIVAPYIVNKTNKTLVDLCLLEDKKCENWCEIDSFMKINTFEQTLLIEYLSKKGDFENAKNLANRIILQQKLNKISFNEYKEKFDTMLNADKSQSNGVSNSLFGSAANQIQNNQMNMFADDGNYQNDNLDCFFGGGGGGSFSNNVNYNSNSYSQQQMLPQMQNMVQMQQVQQVPQMQQMAFGMNNNAPRMAQMRNACFTTNAVMPPPPPPPGASLNRYAPRMPSMSNSIQNNLLACDDDLDFDQERQIQIRENYRRQFKQVEKTKEYDEVTYQGVKSSVNQTQSLVSSSKFWAELAMHLTNPQTVNKFFISESILYLQNKRQFQLACCFIPNHLNPQYEMNTSQNHLEIQAKNAFLVFLKEIKQMEYLPKFGIMLNHRFYDPEDQYIYTDDGLKQQKCIQNDEFKPLKPYCIQTIITNTSGNSLQLQILLDIPAGAVPLETNEYTQISNVNISSYSTKSFVRKFYFPFEGEYQFYPSNVSWGRNVIAKAQSVGMLGVTRKVVHKKISSFADVLNSGKKEDIIQYIREKNIFDPQLFDPNKIRYAFRDKNFYEKTIPIMRTKMYFNQQIWIFSYLHDDLQGIKEYYKATHSLLPNKYNLRLLEYYPYYSNRAHKYLNTAKSKIRNVQLKETYYKFLFDSILTKNQGGTFKLAAIYYLLLQDRIQEASSMLEKATVEQRKEHQLQFDYFECFLDMYQGYPSFQKARKIVEKYKQYPITQWNESMKEIMNTLKQYDSAPVFVEEQTKVEYVTQIYKQGSQVRISIPPETKIEVLIFPIDIELYFSEIPFKTASSFISTKPSKTIIFQSGKSREETVKYEKEFKNALVQIYETKSRVAPKKIQSFEWTNPQLKVKITETKGILQVFFEGKQVAGSYCKIYSKGGKGERFYRDGYTDITGTFKYALSDLQNINRFSILCMNDHGGIINEVAPPSQNSAFFEEI